MTKRGRNDECGLRGIGRFANRPYVVLGRYRRRLWFVGMRLRGR